MLRMRGGPALGMDHKGGLVLNSISWRSHIGQEKVFIWSTQLWSTPMQPPPLPRQWVFCSLKPLFSFQTFKKGLNTGLLLPLWLVLPLLRLQRNFFLKKKKKEDILPLSVYGNGGYICCICYSVHAAVTGINFLLPHEIGGIPQPSDLAASTFRHWHMVAQSLSICLSDEHVTAVTAPPGSFCGDICLKQVIIPSSLLKVLLKFHC